MKSFLVVCLMFLATSLVAEPRPCEISDVTGGVRHVHLGDITSNIESDNSHFCVRSFQTSRGRFCVVGGISGADNQAVALRGYIGGDMTVEIQPPGDKAPSGLTAFSSVSPDLRYYGCEAKVPLIYDRVESKWIRPGKPKLPETSLEVSYEVTGLESPDVFVVNRLGTGQDLMHGIAFFKVDSDDDAQFYIPRLPTDYSRSYGYFQANDAVFGYFADGYQDSLMARPFGFSKDGKGRTIESPGIWSKVLGALQDGAQVCGTAQLERDEQPKCIVWQRISNGSYKHVVIVDGQTTKPLSGMLNCMAKLKDTVVAGGVSDNANGSSSINEALLVVGTRGYNLSEFLADRCGLIIGSLSNVEGISASNGNVYILVSRPDEKESVPSDLVIIEVPLSVIKLPTGNLVPKLIRPKLRERVSPMLMSDVAKTARCVTVN